MGLLDDAIREHLDLKRRRGADPAEVERAEREALGPVRPGPDDQPPMPAVATAGHDDDWDGPEPDDRRAPAPRAFADDEPYGLDDGYDEYEDDEYDYEDALPAPAHPSAAPAGPSASVEPDGAPGPIEFSGESIASEPSNGAAAARPAPDDEYEPSTAEFFESAPSAREHLAARPAVPPAEPVASAEPTSVPRDDPPAAAEFASAPAEQIRPSYDEDEDPLTAEFTVEEPPEPAAAARPVPSGDEDVLEETPEFLSDTPDHDRLWFEQKPPRDFDFDG